MRKIKRRWIALGTAVLLLIAVPTALWVLVTHQPDFYRRTVAIPAERRHAEAKDFVARSLQLRNDIVNEPLWEAVFTDEQVNSWLAEDLVEHFADQIPPNIHDPRVLFELDRVNFGFGLDQGPVRSIVSVAAKIRVTGEHEVSLTIESIRAGAVPLPPRRLLEQITDVARSHGLDVRWEEESGNPVAVIKYTPDRKHRDVVLEKLQVLNGQIRLAGRSTKGRTVARPTLPNRKALQSTFPGTKRKDQAPPATRDNMILP